LVVNIDYDGPARVIHLEALSAQGESLVSALASQPEDTD